jgi:hypothetical protein
MSQSSEMDPFTKRPLGAASDPVSEAASEQSQNGQANVVSPQKLAANRANAQHSTGPRTPEGKEKSKQNSLKHGFFARQPLPAGEEGDKLWLTYSDLVAGVWEHYKPGSYMEEIVAEKIATECIRCSRFLAYESDFKTEAFCWDGVDRILRFQSAINRQLFQAMHELERLQEIRKANSSSPANGSDREPDGGGNGSAAASTRAP